MKGRFWETGCCRNQMGPGGWTLRCWGGAHTLLRPGPGSRHERPRLSDRVVSPSTALRGLLVVPECPILKLARTQGGLAQEDLVCDAVWPWWVPGTSVPWFPHKDALSLQGCLEECLAPINRPGQKSHHLGLLTRSLPPPSPERFCLDPNARCGPSSP